jgi:hypothetical protein
MSKLHPLFKAHRAADAMRELVYDLGDAVAECSGELGDEDMTLLTYQQKYRGADITVYLCPLSSAWWSLTFIPNKGQIRGNTPHRTRALALTEARLQVLLEEIVNMHSPSLIVDFKTGIILLENYSATLIFGRMKNRSITEFIKDSKTDKLLMQKISFLTLEGWWEFDVRGQLLQPTPEGLQFLMIHLFNI